MAKKIKKGKQYAHIDPLMHDVLLQKRWDMELSINAVANLLSEAAGQQISWYYVKSWETGPKCSPPGPVHFYAMMEVFGLNFEEMLEGMGYGKWGHRSKLMRWANQIREAA